MWTLGCEIPDLPRELWTLLDQVPAGRVTTYGDLARALGDVKAARWVGELLLEHEHGPECPCHRVVRSTGEVGLYVTRDPKEKIARLVAEGIEIDANRVDLKLFGFHDFTSKKPLQKLAEFQTRIPERVVLSPLSDLPDAVGGVDVSYLSPREAVSAYALVETASGELLWSKTLRQSVRFPYIPGYLTFREVPIHLELLNAVEADGRLADVLFVDGNGILHHRGAGIATQLGVILDRPTIGVGKSLLCGHVDLKEQSRGEARPVDYNGRTVAMALRSAASHKPIYISPGQRIDVASALAAARQLLHGHRLPEPLYYADALSRQAARE